MNGGHKGPGATGASGSHRDDDTQTFTSSGIFGGGKPPVKHFVHEGFRFRPINPMDAETLRSWRNEEGTRTQFVFTGVLSEADQAKWMIRYLQDPTDLMFLVEADAGAGTGTGTGTGTGIGTGIGTGTGTGEQTHAGQSSASSMSATTSTGFVPIGCAALYHIDRDASEAEFGRLMIGDPGWRGRGVGKIITEALARCAFERMGLKKVYLEVYADNPAACRSYLSAGFTRVPGERDANGRTLIRMEIAIAQDGH